MEARVNLTRLQENLRALGVIGRDEDDGGLYRMAFTEADMEGKKWLSERMKDAGLETRVDGAGNVIGHWPGADPTLPVMLVGSHIDTVPTPISPPSGPIPMALSGASRRKQNPGSWFCLGRPYSHPLRGWHVLLHGTNPKIRGW